MKQLTKKKVITLAILCLVALLSFFVISKIATNANTYTATIQSIDDKKATVMGLTASAALTSTALASVPGDVTTPIANQIMQISSYLMIVVCVLVLEKSLLTVMGYLAFNILIPAACVLLALHILIEKKAFKTWAIKFIVFALVIVTVIPFSLKISDMIYDVNRESIEQFSASIEEASQATESEEKEEGNWLNKVFGKIKDGVTDVKNQAKELLNTFIDMIAMFVITYCAIPILVVLIVLWFLKFLFGITVPKPQSTSLPLLRKKVEEKKEELQEV